MALQSIIDRRLAGKNKSIGNRERFLRRHKEQIREAVKRAVDGRGIRDMEKGEDIRIPKRDIAEPVFGHGSGGQREMVHPGNEDFVRGDRIARPQGGRRGRFGQGPSGRFRRKRGRLRLPPQQGRVHAGLLRRPCAAEHGAHPTRRSARVQDPPCRLHQRRQPEQPACAALDARRDRPAHRRRCEFEGRTAPARSTPGRAAQPG